MTAATARLTLVAGNEAVGLYWASAANRLMFFDSLPELRSTLETFVATDALDAERIIVEQSPVETAEDFLQLLASVPETFSGDLILVREDGSSFLSASGRSGGRVLHALQADDLTFYLGVCGLERTAQSPLRAIG